MRIAVVLPEYPPDAIGGGGVVFESLVREYLLKHEVRVFTAADSTRSWTLGRFGNEAGDLWVNRYPLIPLGKRIPYLRSAMPMNIHGWLDLRRDLAIWKPDVAHIHGYGHMFVDISGRLLARHRIPYVFTCHGIPTRPFRRGGVAKATFQVYQRLGAGRSVLKARAVTAVSKSAAATLVHRAPIQIIPNGVSRLPHSNPQNARALRDRLRISAATPLIAGAGRLSIEKGFDVLIKALDHVEAPLVACVIAGSDAGEGPRLERLAAACRPGVAVLFPGRLGPDEVADLFAIADLVVVPSREESFGLVAFEALGAGKRVVATRAGGLGDFLDPNLVHLVSGDDPNELSNAITSALALGAPSKSRQMEMQSFVEGFSWSSIGRQYEHILGAALSKGSC